MVNYMKSRLVALISIASIALVGACSQPSQLLVPGSSRSLASSALRPGFSSAGRRARYIYFAGIHYNRYHLLGPGEVGVYPATATGDVAPLHVIVGKKTGLFEGGGCCVPQSAWFDPADGSVWTCRTFSKFVSKFSTNDGQDSWGNVKPSSRLVISPKTVSCGGAAVTSEGEIVADDINNAFVATWPPGSTGKAAKSREIAGPATDLFQPAQITFDSNGDYIIADECSPPKCSSNLIGGEILTFDAHANGNVSPLRLLAGVKTDLSVPDGIAFDPIHNMIYVANRNTSTITAYPAGSSGNVAPAVFIHGKKTQLWNPRAVAIDKAGYLYVGNEPVVPGPPPGSILVFAPGANGNVAPIQIIEGSKTGLAEVNGLSLY
jgi:DNA-binding beta-propeller fold protein YncE